MFQGDWAGFVGFLRPSCSSSVLEILHLPQGWPQSPLSREDFPQESCGTWSSPCCLGIPAASDTIRLESLLPCLCLIFCECTFASPVVLSFAFNL